MDELGMDFARDRKDDDEALIAVDVMLPLADRSDRGVTEAGR
jgi:hypothetical protein